MAITNLSTGFAVDDNYPDYEYNVEENLRKLTLVKNMDIVSVVIYSLAFVLGITGNGLVIFITGFRMKKTVNTVWFLSLAIADFVFIFILPLRIANLAQDTHWPFNDPMCKLYHAITHLNLYASVYLLTVISIDRCISVRCPVWARNHRTPRLASFVVLCVWILALLLCSPNIHFRKTKEKHHYDKTRTVCYLNFHREQEKGKILHCALVIFQFISAFVIPFSVIAFCSGAIVLRIRSSKLSHSNKPFKVLTAVIVAFFVLCIPFHIFSFLETKMEVDRDLEWPLRIGIPLTHSLFYVNSCLNPILYFFMGRDSKERLKRSLLSTFENAFAEESSLNTTHTKVSVSTELDSEDL